MSAATASTASPGPLPLAPAWLPGGQLQTIWPALFSRRHAPGSPPVWARERWTTPDGDFIEVDTLDAPAAADAPLLVLFHGLEGSSASHYARAFAHWAADAGVRLVVPHFRGCSGPLNHAPRAYHSGDHEEVGWLLARLRQRFGLPLFAAGVSLGGNALLCWLGQWQHQAEIVDAAAAVSAPLDLAQGGKALSTGANRLYTRMFLNTLKPKCLAKLEQFPGLFARDAMLAARDLHAFDDVVTAPLHGYRDADDYWHRASAKHVLHDITVPTLVLNAQNDPFLPGRFLPASAAPTVTLEYPRHGGHVGFSNSSLDWLPRRLLHFFEQGSAAPSLAQSCQAGAITALVEVAEHG